MTESEYSPEELDLMAKAYERACDKLQALNDVLPEQLERARIALVGAIAEAVEKGERSEEFLVCAALARFCNMVDAMDRLEHFPFAPNQRSSWPGLTRPSVMKRSG